MSHVCLLSCNLFQHHKINRFHWVCEGSNKAYAPLYYRAFWSTLSTKANTTMEKVVTKVYSKHTKYGSIICSNGWIDVLECPLINVMSISLFGNVFEKSINNRGEVKMTQFLVDAIAMVIETLGPTNVVQVCMDNVASNQSVNKLLR